jgi:mannose-1-phosphate guanylyltransferase
MSTPEMPKQFLPLTSSKSMFQQTVERVMDRGRFAPPIIVANAKHSALVENQLAEIGVTDAQLVLEPCARNTAPAIALAALAAGHAQSPLLVMPSDHAIVDVEAFHAATQALLPAVKEGWLATYGIAPTGPETGYGYIRLGEALRGEAVRAVASFIEKPELDRATAMVADGNHVWNGGIFLFRADIFLGALAVHAPEMLHACQQSMMNSVHDGFRILPDAEAFSQSPSDSIDYAVMEKVERVAVAPVSMGWSDVGSWDALYDFQNTDQSGNILQINCAGTLMRSDGLKIHAVGVNDLIVVASGQDILIVPRGKSQDVKKIVEAIKAKNR